MLIYDISRPLTPATAVWPGDQEVVLTRNAQLGDEDSVVNLHALTQSLHAGTHADAPYHYLPDGPTIDEMPLEHFVGRCQVVHTPDDLVSVTADLVDEVLAAHPELHRVLFRTRHSDLPATAWDSDYVYFEPEAIELLGRRGVVLVGTDAPSMDPFTSKGLSAHKALGAHGMSNLENLMLREVPAGLYHLVAAPLKVVGVDGAPVRALLLTNSLHDEHPG
jgi:arylformamidase